MDKRFSYAVQQVVLIGEEIAREFNHPVIGSEHVLLAILKYGNNLLSDEVLKKGIKYRNIFDKIKNIYKFNNSDISKINYSIELNDILEETYVFSLKNKESSASLNSFIFALINLKNAASDLLITYGINIEELSNKILDIKRKKLDNLGISDLHLMGINNKDPLIGREKEIKRIIYALARRNKPNAILLGDPGVGKTAIVEEIAKRLLNDEVKELKGKIIYELDIASTVSGTKYRGEFEEKVKKIIKKVKDEGNIILFIDEIHSLVKAGGAEGAIDASNILKPYLARAEIQVIGATTSEEFNGSFEKDKALKRRFQLININENTLEDTKKILKGIKSIYEDYYQININDEVLDYICEKSNKCFLNQKFPDKAIDLLDNSCVGVEENLTCIDVDRTLETIFNISNVNDKFEEFNNIFDKEIYSQNEAKERILKSLANGSKKILFVGKQGVGKNKVVRLIGEHIFLNNYNIINSEHFCIKQSIYSSNYEINSYHNMLKLIKDKSDSLVVFENIDLASKETIEFIINMISNGYIFDDTNNKILCSHVTFIFVTSNRFNQDFKMNVNSNLNRKKELKRKLKQEIGQELFLLLDDVIEFADLDLNAYSKIINKYLDSKNVDSSLLDEEEINNFVKNKNINGGDSALEFAKEFVNNLKKEKIN